MNVHRISVCAWLVIAAAAVALVPRATAAHSGAPQQRTVISFRGVIYSFAQSARRVAWIDTHHMLRTRDVSRTQQDVVSYARSTEHPLFAPGRLALNPKGAIWLSRNRGSGGFDIEDRVLLASRTARRGRSLARREHVLDGGGGYVTSVAADAASYAFGVVEVREAQPTCSCDYALVGGGVWTTDGRSMRQVAGASPAALVAKAGGRVALVAAAPGPADVGTPVPSSRVQIFDGRSGEIIASITASAPVRAIGMSPNLLVALADTRIERYDARTGELLGATTVAAAAPGLDVSGDLIVFHDRRSVRVLRHSTGEVSVIARSERPWQSTFAQIEGRTATWVETTKRGAPSGVEIPRWRGLTRVRAMTLAAT